MLKAPSPYPLVMAEVGLRAPTPRPPDPGEEEVTEISLKKMTQANYQSFGRRWPT